MTAARLAVRVQPGARVAGLAGRAADGSWKVKVREPAREGRANEAVCELLAERLALPRRSVRVARGEASRSKTIVVEGLSQGEAESRLEQAKEES